MKSIALALVLGSLVLLGCTQQPAAPSPTAGPTAIASPTATPSVDIGGGGQELSDASEELSELENLTTDLEAADLDVTDEELQALG